jgi:hypothetical protein
LAPKYTYWFSTAVVSLLYLTSATFYVIQGDTVRQSLGALGYPAYLVPILIVVKILAVAAILSRVSMALSDLAYAGMFYHLLLAISAHVYAGEPSAAAPAMLGLLLLITSFLTQNAARANPSPYAPSASA